jgi:N,N'-diacetyllegionaminate synthase
LVGSVRHNHMIRDGEKAEGVHIGRRTVGPGSPVLFIAEAGVNHNGDPRLALQLVDAAAAAGADAVKFQTFRAEEVVSFGAPKARYQIETTGTQESQLEMIRRLELAPETHRELIQRCDSKGIQFLSTPFDFKSADLLETLGVVAYKIPSGEITNWPFLSHIAAKGKPVLLSTGMSDLAEVEDAVKVLRSGGCKEFIVLHCTSSYPAPPSSVNLRAMQTMANAFHVPVGLSDHTQGSEAALAAVALGASVIEKHFTLDRSLPGPDHKASLEPGELNALVQSIRIVESALGDGLKRSTSVEQDVKRVARRSIVSRQTISSGTVITRELIAFKRPGTGIAPSEFAKVIGRKAARTIVADTLITLEDLA